MEDLLEDACEVAVSGNIIGGLERTNWFQSQQGRSEIWGL